MGKIDTYHKMLEGPAAAPDAAGAKAQAREQRLFRTTGQIRELPTKVGLVQSGLHLTLIVILLVFGAFLLLRVFGLPKFNYIVEKRLGDHYRTRFSEPGPRDEGIVQARDFLPRPLATDLDQDGENIYLATRGHGIQALHKDDVLWKTHDAKSTRSELPNDVKAIDRQQTEDDARLWALGFDGSVTLGRPAGGGIDFRSLYAAGAWRYVTAEDISATHLVDKRYFIMGTRTKGAGIYDTHDHQWQDFKEIRGQNVKKILYEAELLWFLTDQGVFVYKIVGREGRSNRLICRILSALCLKAPDLSDLKVYGAAHALAITTDRGCYLYQGKWSDKLLGGESVPGLIQEAIKWALLWQDRIVVIGEPFGIAAYHPVNRNWSVIQPGPLPALNDFDYDTTHIVMGSVQGVHVVQKQDTPDRFHYVAKMPAADVSSVSLFNGGFLYRARHGVDHDAGWMNFDDRQKTLVTGGRTPIDTQPQITDVIVEKNLFWIGTRGHGVLRYDTRDRGLTRVSRTQAGPPIIAVRKLGRLGKDLIALSEEHLYRWNAAEDQWVSFLEQVVDFRIDPSGDILWRLTTGGEIIRGQGTDATGAWFSGQGPEHLDPDSAAGVFVSASKGNSPHLLFRGLAEKSRTLYPYDIRKAKWEAVRTIPGTHTVEMFAPLAEHIFSMDPTGAVYDNDRKAYGRGKPKNRLDAVLLVRQAAENGTVTVYGPGGTDAYHPDQGEWTYTGYDFLNKGETIRRLFPIAPAAGGRIAETSRNRLIFIDDQWTTALGIQSGFSGSQFDGHAFWRLSAGRLERKALKKEKSKGKETISLSSETYFSGSAPDLSTVLEAWYDAPHLYLANRSHLCAYNTRTHTWRNESLPGGMAVDMRRRGQVFYVADRQGYRLHSITKLDGKPISFPAADLKKIDFEHSPVVATFGSGAGRKTFVRKPKAWEPLKGRSSRFMGGLNNISALFQTSHGRHVWAYTPQGRIGRYTGGQWQNFKLPPDIVFRGFWHGLTSHVYVIGRRKGRDQADLPLLFFEGNTLRRLTGLPDRVREARLGERRHLWMKAENGDPFVLDLHQPVQPALDLAQICSSAASRLTTVFYFDLVTGSFARAPVDSRIAGPNVLSALESADQIKVHRDDKGVAKAVFLSTPRRRYCFERIQGSWFLTAENHVLGKLPMNQALDRAAGCGHRRKPSQAFRRQANLIISTSESGRNPIFQWIRNKIPATGFEDAASDVFKQIRHSTEATAGSLTLTVENKRGIRINADLGSGTPVSIPYANGQIEVDRPFIDAAVDGAGKWWILRPNSLTCYDSDALNTIARFGRFKNRVSADAVLRFIGAALVIQQGGTYKSLTIQDNLVASTPLQGKARIYADEKTGLDVFKSLRKIRIRIGDAAFRGGGRFPFDTLEAIVAAKDRISLKTPRGVWDFVTDKSDLDTGEYLPFPHALSRSGTLTVCGENSAGLKIGSKYHGVTPGFPEILSESCEVGPEHVATEKNWRWYLDARRGHLSFEAKVGEQWQRTDRIAADGRFADNIAVSMAAYKDAVYVATRKGVLRFGDTRSDKEMQLRPVDKTLFLSGVRELKIVEGVLYALTGDARVLRLMGDNQWEPDEKKTAKDLFDQATPVFASPYLTVAAYNNRLKITCENNRPVLWDQSVRRFRMDVIRDFTVTADGLLVLNQQSEGAVAHSFDAADRHYLPAGEPLTGFEIRGDKIYGRSTSQIFLRDPARTEDSTAWEPVAPNLELAAMSGLAFRKNLLAPPGEDAVFPIVGGHSVKAFWNQGRFSFDFVYDIEGGASSGWWAVTAAGLVSFQGLEDVQFKTLHPDVLNPARIKHDNRRLNIAMNDQEYFLADPAGDLKPKPDQEMTAFSRTVFDYRLDPDKTIYTWNTSEIPEQDQRRVFQVITEDEQTRSDVLAEGRFFWDQLISAVHDPVENCYWTIGPGHLSTNRYHLVRQRPALSPIGFFFEESELEGFRIRDTIYANGTLYVLHVSLPIVPDRLISGAAEDGSIEDGPGDAPAADEPVERVRKRKNRQWGDAADEAYPFWQPMVSFRLEDHTWSLKQLTFSRFYARENNFSFEGPADYPLFSRFSHARNYGKFSFDYLTAIHAVGNTLWAGSKGGLVKLRCLADGEKRALRLEQLYLPQSGLHVSVAGTPFYDVASMRVAQPRRKLRLLERSADNGRFVQTLDLPAWEKKDPETVATQSVELPLANGFKYRLTYDPVRDAGRIDVAGTENDPVTLCRYKSLTRWKDRLHQMDSGRRVFQADENTYGFTMPERPAETFTAPLSTEDLPVSETVFRPLAAGDGPLAWGVIGGDTPAVRLDSGEILVLTGAPALDALKVESTALVWWSRSDRSNPDRVTAHHLDIQTGRLTAADDTGSRIQWADYTTRPGDSISRYLLDHGIVEKRNFFQKLFGRKQNELKYWVDIIAKKNNIAWGGNGDYDYPLQVGKVYQMPEKGLDAQATRRAGQEQLVIGGQGFARWGVDENPESGVLVSPHARIGFVDGHFMAFDLHRHQVVYQRLPADLPARRLWQSGNRILMSFSAGDDLELWEYFPQKIGPANMNPDQFHVIRVLNGSQILEAHPKGGIIVDNGFDRKHIIKSSELFFGTQMDKVVDIVADVRGDGYWFATATSGLVWSKQPF